MMKAHARVLLGLMASIAATSAVNAAVIDVGNPNPGVQPADLINVPTTWTANNTYNLRDQIYVVDGATLTIQAGVVIASDVTANGGGALAITRGCRILALGTQNDPIIFTSKNDVYGGPGVLLPNGNQYNGWAIDASHPTGRNPKTGQWRVAANEWGNLTMMGRAFISNGPGQTHHIAGNTATCTNTNLCAMEGLTAQVVGDPNVLYGGGNDDHDGGTLQYVSFRYGGRVLGLGDELNGISMGGIGRETDVHHVEVMNNVDDGIETWGGTVNYKYISIWNIGDDSMDIDQGWRGKSQFGLIVQGHSLVANSGSGLGDNCFEVDGAEDSDAQPVTTAQIYNWTVVGQPISGDKGTAWRDGARVQYRNCIFMNIGEQLIFNEHLSDNGADGYGFNGTLSFCDIWTTPYTATSTVNPCNNPGNIYTAQSAGNAAIGQGFLAEMTDSVFFNNSAIAYNDNTAAIPCPLGSNSLGVTLAGGSNPAKGNVVIPGTNPLDAPIAGLTRAAGVPVGGSTVLRVTSIDPRAANAATNSVSVAPANGFYNQANYRGGFASNQNWLCDWTAADAFGLNQAPPAGCVKKCIGDIDGNFVVNLTDLLLVIANWNQGAGNPADVNDDNTVNLADLLAVIGDWGTCRN